MMRSILILEVTTAEKEDEEFKIRKRRKDDARHYTCGNVNNSKLLAKTCQRQEELQSIDDVELAHYRNVFFGESSS